MFFEKKVDLRSKKAMSEFLAKHFRYHTMNNWNGASSYANNVKVHRLGLGKQQLNAAFEVLATDYWDEISQPIDEFTDEMHGDYTIGSNGRSSGYLVLYQSSLEATDHKSHCRSCGQRNFRYCYTADMTTPEGLIMANVIANEGCWFSETYLSQSAIAALQLNKDAKLAIIDRAKKIARDYTVGNKCGACGAEGERGRINYDTSPRRLAVYSGRSLDQNEDFPEWSASELRDRVALVRRFDQACDEIRDNFIYLIENYTVQDEVVMVPKHHKVLVPVAVSA